MNSRFVSFVRVCLFFVLLVGMLFQPQSSAYALTTLTVEPITWNVIGLDSNNVNVGPNHFPVGARVCNTGSEAATNVTATWNWVGAHTYINLRSGTLDPNINLGTLNAGACADAYFEVEVTRNASAYDTTARYRIDVTAGNVTGTISTPTPRELYVEHLVSQSRNAVTDVLLDGVSIPAGGTMTLMVGNTYTIQLVGYTATQGYEQLESFINIPNTIFQINSVTFAHSANAGTDPDASTKLYANGCNWENDPNSPNYRSCLGVGKYGGNITVTYQVTILQVPGAPLVNPQPLSTLIYDFSGSSYHYNSDYDVSTRYAYIVNASLTKSFSPKTILPGGTATLTFTITNPGSAAITNANFTDTLPGNVTLAANVTTPQCGGAITGSAGGSLITVTNATIAGNSTCSITVTVTSSTNGTYNNTTTNLLLGSTDTGSSGSDTLIVSSQPPPPTSCTTSTPMATWTLENHTASTVTTNGPFSASFQEADVITATGSHTPVNGSASGIANTTTFPTGWSAPSTTGNTGNSWGIPGGWLSSNPATPATATTPYFQFQVDASNYGGVAISSNYNLQGNWSNSGNWYVISSTDGITWSLVNTGAWNKTNAWQTGITGTTTLSGNSTVYFRIFAAGAQYGGNPSVTTGTMYLDGITITGCARPTAPTLSKSFSPSTISTGSTSTLTFTLTNPNSTTSLTGVSFTDVLPDGLTVTSGTSTACTTGTLTRTSPKTISLSGGTIAASGTCTINVTVTGAVAGSYTNVTSSVSSTETGPNTTSSGFGTSSLTVIDPPVINKSFTANPIFTGNTTTLSFTISNPNTSVALTGVSFTDTLPAGLDVVNSVSVQCGGVLTAIDNLLLQDTVALSGGSLVAGGSCSFSVTVIGTTTGLKTNSVTVSSTNGGTGNTSTADVLVKDPTPLISMLKQVGPTASGPWTSFLTATIGSNVFYKFTVENIGDVALNPVTITDDTMSLAGCTWVDGDGTVLTAPYSLPVADAADNQLMTCVLGPITAVSGSHVNTATATGTSGTATSDSSSATYATPALTLVKSVTPTSFASANDTLNYSYLVTNSGFAPLLGPVTVTDDKATVTCPAVTTVGDLDTWFDVGESITCTATYTVVAGDVTAGSVTNTATASASGVNSNTDSETVYRLPDFTVSKTNNVSGSVVQNGTFNWTITVSQISTGQGSFADTQTILSDTLPGAAGYYGAPSVTNGAIPPTGGTINCSIVVTALNCVASGAVTFPAGASFSVTFAVTPTAAGSLSNTATVDPSLSITELDENNNSSTDVVTVVAPPSITKSFSPDPILVNGISTLTFTITNSNVSAALTSVGFTDSLPLGLEVAPTPNASTSVGCGSATFAPLAGDTTLTFTGGTIPSSGSCTVTVDITATTDGLKNNTTGNVTSTNGGTGNTANDTLTVNPSADLSITKTDGVTSVLAGGTTTYTIRVTNNGPSGVTGAILSDPVAAGLNKTGVSCSATPGQCVTAPTVAQLESGAFALPALASGQFYEITVTADVTATTGSVTNTATITAPAGTTDPTPGNNTASDNDTVNEVADLSVTKTDGVTSVNAGGTTTYTIRITNNGPSTVTGGTFSDPAVAGLSKTAVACSATPGQCVTAPTVAILESGAALPTLASGQFYETTVTATVTATSGSVTNTATAATGTSTTDPTPGNNNASDTDIVNPIADLAITKTDGSATYVPGVGVTYTVTVTNSGPSDVTGATVADTKPTQITTWAWACTSQTGGATGCTPAASSSSDFSDSVDIPSGGSIVYTLTANTDPAATGNLVNTATVTVPVGTTDPTPGNNSSTDTDTPNLQSDLAITKTDGVTSVNANGTTTYTVRVTNNGPSDVTGAILSDPAVAGLSKTGVSCSATPGQCVTAPTIAQLEGGTFALPALASGQFYEIAVTADVTATNGNVTNTATVTTPAGTTDPTPGNNSASDTNTVNPIADLAITKTDGVASVNAGGTTTYTIRVTNNGPSMVTGATLTDPVAAGLSKTTVACSATPGECITAPTVTELESGTFILPDLISGAFYEITVTTNVTATSGSVTNTATVTPPAGTTDPTPGNNTANDTDTINSVADLSVTKTDGSATYVPGVGVTYTVTVTNGGSSDVIGATVADTKPTQITTWAWACTSQTGGATGCTPAASSSSDFSDSVDIPSGGSIVYTVTANIDSAATGNLVNTATVSVPAGTTDPTPGNNSATDTDTPNPQADLSVTKTDGVVTYTPSGTTTYTIVVSNAGPSDVIGATFTDTFPAAITNASWTCAGSGGGTCTASGTGDINDNVDIPVGGSVTYTVTATISASATGTLVNTATITPPVGTTDPNPGNNSATDTDTPNLQADLSVTKTDGVTTYTPGGNTTYTIIVSNAGPSAVIGATFIDTFPVEITSASWTCVGSGGGTCTASGTGNINDSVDLPVGGSVTYTVTATINASATGNLTNTATITPPVGTTDPTPGNNSATDTDTSNAAADLSVTKTDGSTIYTAGTPITYTITVSNVGGISATGTVTDTFPASLTSITWSCAGTGGATCGTSGSGDINDNVSIPAGESVTYTVNATVISNTTGNLVNTATATLSSGIDPTPGDNSSTDTDTPNPQADLFVTKTDGVATYTPGGTTSYTIVVSNAGPSAVTAATFTDTFPAAITSASWTCAGSGGGTCTASGTGNINDSVDLPVGGSVTYTVVATISASATGSLTNTATITAPAGITDPNPGNNSATDTDTVALIADPALSKAGNPTQASVGDTVTFTVTVTNAGTAPATNVVVTDPLPAMFDVTAVNVSVNNPPFFASVNVTPPIGVGPAPYTVVVTLNDPLDTNDIVTITITTVVNSLGNPPINNTASLATTGSNSLTSNDSDTVALTLRSSNSPSLISNRPALLPATGFAPNLETKLHAQPQDRMYAATDVMLEIPSLGLKIPIVGVPKKNRTWDVTWLGKQAGWLEGSAFPSWSGNSVLTSHVYTSNGLPGPFVNLNKLKFGDQIIVHAYGQKYIFEVQTNQVVAPNDTSAFKHEEKPWLTLITCKEYDEKTNTYKKRVIIRAVLVKVMWDK